MTIFPWFILTLLILIAATVVIKSLYILLWLLDKNQPLLFGLFTFLVLFVIGVVGGAFIDHHGHDARLFVEVCAYSAIAILFVAIAAEAHKWMKRWEEWTNELPWKKGRSEQGWEPAQTEVYGDQHAEAEYEHALEMSPEEAARFAMYVARSGGNVTVNVVDEPVRGMRDVSPRRPPLWLVKK
jgi:hypothetical protein